MYSMHYKQLSYRRAKTWYPVIDYLTCLECGTCVINCPHSVFDSAKIPSPVVLNAEFCIDHCHGCGNRYQVGAITYVGDDTGWNPPNGMGQIESTPHCSCVEPSERTITIDYLYLDLKTCDRCIGTDKALEEVLLTLTPTLRLAGYDVEYRKIEVKTAELAEQFQFLSSPTIRVNGWDICSTVKENSCGCCGEISGTNTQCRIFEYNGENYEVPPKELLAKSIFQAVFGIPKGKCSCES